MPIALAANFGDDRSFSNKVVAMAKTLESRDPITMKRLIETAVALALASALVSCGGGGGSPGTTTTGSGSQPGGVVVPATAGIFLALTNSSGQTVIAIDGKSQVLAQATVRDASGQAVSGLTVTFSASAALVQFLPSSGTASTGSDGTAIIQVQPTTASTPGGAGNLTASATVDGKALIISVPFSVPAH